VRRNLLNALPQCQLLTFFSCSLAVL